MLEKQITFKNKQTKLRFFYSYFFVCVVSAPVYWWVSFTGLFSYKPWPSTVIKVGIDLAQELVELF